MSGLVRDKDNNALEKKIKTLEERLVLVERFVEMRFCETFRDFTVRNLPSKDLAKPVNQEEIEEEHLSPVNTTDEEEDTSTQTYRTRSGRKTTRLTGKTLGARTRKGLDRTLKKTLKVTVQRLELEEESGDQNENQVVNSVEEAAAVIKINVGSENEQEENDDNGGNDYFLFPSEAGEGGPASEDGNEDDQDQGEDWNMESGGEDPDDSGSDKEFKIKASGTKRKRSRKSTLEKKKKYEPASLKLLPAGVQLQIVNPDKTNLKECPICHLHTKPEKMDRHLKTHAAERHLQCSMCDLRFYSKDTLTKHERRHTTNVKTKLCRLCSKGFEYPSDVLIHERGCIRRHLESKKPVDAKIMEDVRRKSENVELQWPDPNEKIPPGMKKCLRCNTFVEEGQYLKHVQEVHYSWKCTICEKGFVKKGGLVRHLCTVHGNRKREEGKGDKEAEDKEMGASSSGDKDNVTS